MYFTLWLLIAQTLGIAVAAVAAIVEIESIVLSGPLLSVSGAVLAYLSFRQDRLLGLLYGLAAPTVSVSCLLVICCLNWSQADAQWPVSIFLCVFASLCVAACAMAVEEIRAAHGRERNRTPFQYSIAALLTLMLVLSLILGLAQSASDQGIATGVFLGYVGLFIYVLSRFFSNRRLEKLAQASSFLAPTREE